MARNQSPDYGDKRQAILDAAARLFARSGYPGVKLEEIAKSCRVAKSVLYHYFASKEEILFEILSEHLETVIEAIASQDLTTLPAGGYDEILPGFQAFVRIYTRKSIEARSRHVVAMSDVKYLEPASQKKIVALERRLLKLVTAYLGALNPGLPPRLYAPYSLILLGVLNWTDIWYKPSGAVDPEELNERISSLFLKGYLAQA